MSLLNLNQMGALDVLLQERNVRRAAERFGVTQSAMSHTLRQLRESLDDPLLVRSGNKMVLTPRAEAMRSPLRRALSDLRSAVEARPDFVPRESARRFVIACSDAVAVTLIPILARDLAHAAPHTKLELRALAPEQIPDLLEAGELDLSVSPVRPDAPGMRARALYTTSWRVMCRRRHPALTGALDLDTYCALPHALVGTGSGAGLVDEALARRGRSRNVTLRIPYFLAVPAILERTDHVITLPDGPARYFARAARLQDHDPPLRLPSGRVHGVWHERFDNDPGLSWMRQRVTAAAARI